MRNLIYIFGLALFMASCAGEPAPEVPPAIVLDQEKFTEVMLDLALVEAVYNRQLAQDDESMAKIVTYEHTAEVWEAHGIDAEVFEASMDWYSRHEPVMLEIYEDVLEGLATVAEE